MFQIKKETNNIAVKNSKIPKNVRILDFSVFILYYKRNFNKKVTEKQSEGKNLLEYIQ